MKTARRPGGQTRHLRNGLENSRSSSRVLVQIHIILRLLILTPLEFAAKLYHEPACFRVSNSLSGVFYEIFWCLVAAFASSCAPLWIIAVGVVIVTADLRTSTAFGSKIFA
jgi:hypothetical protein